VPSFESVAHPPFSKSVADAAQRAQQHLLRLQHEDGYWCGELLVDATLCADFAVYQHWSGSIDRVLEEKCAAHVLRRQLADGGWPIYEDGPSELNASVKAYFALKLAGHDPAAPHMQSARACILRLGGIPRMNTYAKLYLALLGQFPWAALPTVPAEMVFFPRWLFFNLYEMSSWSRAMLIPLAILNHYRPVKDLPLEMHLHELYPAGSQAGDLRHPWSHPRLSWRNFFLVCDRLLKLLHRLPWKPWRRLALRRCEAWMLERIGEGSDGLGAIYPAMLNALIALQALGYAEDHPVRKKARRDFEGLFVDDPRDFRIQPCLSPVWDTAITLIALLDSGIDPQRPEIQHARAWLEAREVRVAGDWAMKTAGVEPSGWAFEFANRFYPDTDDTMMVLAALVRTGAAPKALRDRALAWLLSFQCRDGGWAAFDRDVTQRWLEDVPFADHHAILDPACSDLTGRMLELLGLLRWPKERIEIQRALAFLRRTQEPDGSWYGRWGVNYLYGTWQVLRGLQAIGEDMSAPWVVRAGDWLESCQHEDGGWGETCATYDDPRCKGSGPSTASQTAWAVMGLIAADARRRRGKAIERGIRWLLAAQNADGSWTENATTGTGFPRVFYLRYDMYRNNWPLLALAHWQRHIARE
jgi:squalene-hopene/tetraprenyl-beta-curcumene cyclase